MGKGGRREVGGMEKGKVCFIGFGDGQMDVPANA